MFIKKLLNHVDLSVYNLSILTIQLIYVNLVIVIVSPVFQKINATYVKMDI